MSSHQRTNRETERAITTNQNCPIHQTSGQKLKSPHKMTTLSGALNSHFLRRWYMASMTRGTKQKISQKAHANLMQSKIWPSWQMRRINCRSKVHKLRKEHARPIDSDAHYVWRIPSVQWRRWTAATNAIVQSVELLRRQANITFTRALTEESGLSAWEREQKTAVHRQKKQKQKTGVCVCVWCV